MTILLADDERNIRATLRRALALEGYRTVEAVDGAEALDRLASGEVDAAILDLEMPVLDGLGVLKALRERGLAIPCIVLTAHGSIGAAVEAVRLGAFDFIEKPPAVERIVLALENALRSRALEAENRRLAEESGLGSEMLGTSPALRALAETVRQVAPTEAAVLILGENGSGKELVARAIHAGGPRSRRPLVVVNCAAIPPTLFESELFGHARGAFTGATEARRGKFQQADRGTIFLDEIGEVPLPLQPKMLRALETGEVERVGGQASERVDVRVVAATNRDLPAEVTAGRFRQDLFYRLNVIPVRVPPLRERAGDVPLLARHFLDVACRRQRAGAKALSDAAVAALSAHAWPGNVRELRNLMERAAILVRGDVVEPRDLGLPAEGTPAAAASPAEPRDLASAVTAFEREFVLAALERNRWRMTAAARELGLERSHLYKKARALGIERRLED